MNKFTSFSFSMLQKSLPNRKSNGVFNFLPDFITVFHFLSFKRAPQLIIERKKDLALFFVCKRKQGSKNRSCMLLYNEHQNHPFDMWLTLFRPCGPTGGSEHSNMISVNSEKAIFGQIRDSNKQNNWNLDVIECKTKQNAAKVNNSANRSVLYAT